MEDLNENGDVIVYEGKSIKLSDFPSFLTNQVSLINDNSKKIAKAKEKAEKAYKAAEKAKNEKVKWYKKTASIEALQKALDPIIDALDGQTDIADNLSDSIRAISDATRFLFVLGVSNMAANRMVIRELELKLSNATKEQLSALAQQELQNVLDQIKAQQHVLEKLEKLESKQSEYDTLANQFNEFKTSIQDQVDSTNRKIDQNVSELKNNIQEKANSIDDKIDNNVSELMNKMNGFVTKSDADTKYCNKDVINSFTDQQKVEIAALRKQKTIFKIVSFVALFASIVALLIAL